MTEPHEDRDLSRMLEIWKSPEPSYVWMDTVVRDMEIPQRRFWRVKGSLAAALAAGVLIGFIAPPPETNVATTDIATLINWLW